MDDNEKKSKDKKNQEEQFDSLTMDLYRSLKKTNKTLWILVFVLAIGIILEGLYFTYKWSEFETVVVDSKDGGNASYVGNDGDINNYGESGSPQEEELVK